MNAGLFLVLAAVAVVALLSKNGPRTAGGGASGLPLDAESDVLMSAARAAMASGSYAYRVTVASQLSNFKATHGDDLTGDQAARIDGVIAQLIG